MEQEGRSKVTTSDDDTNPVKADCSIAKMNNWVLEWQVKFNKEQ